jgi:hypothetical protein
MLNILDNLISTMQCGSQTAPRPKMKISMLTNYIVFLSVFKVVAPALWRRGLCYGQLIKVFEGPSREQCLLSCIDSHQKCEWTSFDFD